MNRLLIIILCLNLTLPTVAQIHEGKIVYERKTNLYKRFKDEKDIDEWIRPEDRNKVDMFELYFNDSLSHFKPQESELKERMGWATSKNECYKNLKDPKFLWIKDVWGEKLYMSDSSTYRKWQITDNHRNIAGFSCRKAVFSPDDSTRIYAWYADEVMPSVGPESFGGLPGAILGLASEDGGIIYFAKTVEQTKPLTEVLSPPKKKQKIYARAELKSKLEQQYGENKYGKRMIKNLFGYW